MALTQRFESYGSHHPRKTFAFGLTAGLASGTGIVLAVALTVGIGARSEGQFVASGVSQGVVATSSLTDEQAYLAEQNYLALHGTAADTNAFEGAGVVAEYGRLGGPQEAIGMDPYGGFVEPGPQTANSSAVPVESYIDEHERLLQAAGIELAAAALPSTEGIVTASRITDEQAYVVEQDYRSAHGIVDTRMGVRETTLTPELRAGMDDRVSGHPFTRVTPELRAGIEG